MKKVFANNEVAHIWAQNSQNEGRNSAGNIFFRNGEIYSYGHHFCMGKILPSGIVLLTNRKYSNTTSKHQGYVSYAVNHMERVWCAYPEKGIESNLKEFQAEMKSAYETILSPRKRPQTKEAAKQEIARIAENIDKYLAAMGCDMATFQAQQNEGFEELEALYLFAQSQDLSQLNQSISTISEERERKKEAARLKAEKELKAKIKKWQKGENVSIYGAEKVYLRAMDGILETSKGARVSLDSAKVLFDMIQAGKDIKGHNIEHYTVISLNGVLTIGCHKITRKEINKFAQKMNWGAIPENH